MRKSHGTIIQLFFLLVLSIGAIVAQESQQMNMLLKEVKDASYYDSTKLFEKGDEAEKLALQNKITGVSSEVNLYYGNYYFYVRNLTKANVYFEKALNLAIKEKNTFIELLAKIRISFLKFENGNSDLAEKELKELLLIARKNQDYKNTAELLNLLGIIDENENKMADAARKYLEGYSLAEINKLEYYPGVFLNNLGLIKYFTGEIAEAKVDFEKGLALSEKENNKRLTSHIQLNLCIVHVAQNEPKKAMVLFEKLMEYSRVNNFPTEIASAFINLSSALRNRELYSESLVYLDSAIAVLDKHNLYSALTKAWMGKVSVLVLLNRINEAEIALKHVDDLVLKTKILEDKSSAYFLRYQVENKKKNWSNALLNYQKHINLRDSMEALMNSKIIEELQVKYKVQGKEIELEREKSKTLILEKSNQEERFFKWIILGVSIIVLLFVLIFVFVVYSKKMQEKKEQYSQQLIKDIESERYRISMDLHDDIGQSLSMIKSRMNHVAADKEDVELENELGRVIEQTRQISHQLFPSHLEKVGLIRSVAGLLENAQKSTSLECSYELADSLEQLPTMVKMHIFRILQECLNNTVKHAKATALKFSIIEKGDEYLMTFQDNGTSFQLNKKNPGMGILSMQERAKIIGGILSIDEKGDKGFKILLKFNKL